MSQGWVIQDKFEENEIDNYATNICPYDDKHTITSQTELNKHLAHCETKRYIEQYKPQLIHLCVYYNAHVFIDKKKMFYHVPRCTLHPLNQKRMNTIIG